MPEAYPGSPQVPPGSLPSYKTDWSDVQFRAEMRRVHEETAQDRMWFFDSGLSPYETDEQIVRSFMSGELVRVEPRPGVIPIRRLLEWDITRSRPDHPYHYSPPYLKPEASYVLGFIGNGWSKLQRERGQPLIFLPVTSMTRSSQYQGSLRARPGRKIAIDRSNGDKSSHEYGYAFDIDACGVYVYEAGTDTLKTVNPRTADWPDYADIVAQGREDLAGILGWLKDRQIVNPVEEVPDSQEWCYHICVNPQLSMTEILDRLRS